MYFGLVLFTIIQQLAVLSAAFFNIDGARELTNVGTYSSIDSSPIWPIFNVILTNEGCFSMCIQTIELHISLNYLRCSKGLLKPLLRLYFVSFQILCFSGLACVDVLSYPVR